MSQRRRKVPAQCLFHEVLREEHREAIDTSNGKDSFGEGVSFSHECLMCFLTDRAPVFPAELPGSEVTRGPRSYCKGRADEGASHSTRLIRMMMHSSE